MSTQTTSTVPRLSPTILAGGLVTSVLALGLEYALSSGAEFSLMGLYLWFVVPIGALLVGALAGSGYGIASWLTGARISGALMGAVIVLQVVVYFVARYIAFASFDPPLVLEDGTSLGFVTFLDIVAQSTAFEDGEPLGAWGYFFELLAVSGFAAGGLAGVAVMRKKPYCADCQRYMQSSTLLWLPLSPPGKPPGKRATLGEADEYQRAAEQAYEDGHRLAREVVEGAAQSDVRPYGAARAEHDGAQKAIQKLPLRLVIGLQRCKACNKGNVVVNEHSGQGEQMQNQLVAFVELPAEAVVGLTQ